MESWRKWELSTVACKALTRERGVGDSRSPCWWTQIPLVFLWSLPLAFGYFCFQRLTPNIISSFRGLFLDYWAALLIDQTDRSTGLEVSWVALWSVTKIHGGVWKSSFLTLSRDKVRRWNLHSKEPPHRPKAALSRALLVIVPSPFFVFPFCPPAHSLTGSPGSTSM